MRGARTAATFIVRRRGSCGRSKRQNLQHNATKYKGSWCCGSKQQHHEGGGGDGLLGEGEERGEHSAPHEAQAQTAQLAGGAPEINVVSKKSAKRLALQRRDCRPWSD